MIDETVFWTGIIYLTIIMTGIYATFGSDSEQIVELKLEVGILQDQLEKCKKRYTNELGK